MIMICKLNFLKKYTVLFDITIKLTLHYIEQKGYNVWLKPNSKIASRPIC